MCIHSLKQILNMMFKGFLGAFLSLFIIGSANSGSFNKGVNSLNYSSFKIQEKASLFKKLEENNHLSIEKRIELYHQLKKDEYDHYKFEDDRELNQYGYSLLMTDKIEEALEIFKLLVAEFPKVANTFDSLGEAYLLAGNEELSLLNYEKSVAMDPNNHHGINQINKIKGLELLVTDWGKEIFHFPIHFAPELNYQGIEEVVFPKNWIHKDSTDFWSYVFVWALDNKKEMSPSELEISLKHYFDGLAESDDDEEEIPKTTAKFEWNSNPKDSATIVGKLQIFDRFATNEILDLNAKIYSSYCEDRQKLILLFRFSPLEEGHPIWEKLASVKLRSTICEE